uniref:Uncharacterized protein n=1 Tax=Romanomermis culicivorax TaxID=13658 RepID=A0A915K1Z3_ROMCU
MSVGYPNILRKSLAQMRNKSRKVRALNRFVGRAIHFRMSEPKNFLSARKNLIDDEKLKGMNTQFMKLAEEKNSVWQKAGIQSTTVTEKY